LGFSQGSLLPNNLWACPDTSRTKAVSMLKKDDIIDSLTKFIIAAFRFGEADDLNSEESLLKKGIIDSTGVIELIEFIESEFHVRVEDEEIIPDNLDSINRAAAFVMRKQADF
jgi:acyl carrier protein